MKLKLTPIAFIILATSLTACSGGSNKSTPVAESPKIDIAPDNQDKEKSENASLNNANRNDIEYALDKTKTVKWRQLTAFLPSSETSADNPLGTSGKMSQEGSAAYIDGDLRYSDNGVARDLRKNQNETDYDPSFLTKAEINPHKLQSLAIKNGAGQTVMRTHFVNQTYSSYLSFKAEAPFTSSDEDGKVVKALDAPTAYIAVPTKADKAILDRKVKATYKGHTIGNQKRENNHFTLGDITLNADFSTMKISGEITNRNDELLRGRAQYEGAGWKGFTTDSEEVEEGYTTLISEAEMAKREEQHRTLAVRLLPADIKIANGVIGFKSEDKGLEFTALNGESVTTGGYSGVFAGPEAQEVVGKIESGENFISFGATEVQK
ncbi:hypothetical protein ACWIVU_07395 [Ursidibacter arcticus]